MGEVSLVLFSREVMLRVGVFAISVFFSEGKARAPLPAMACVAHGIRVVVNKKIIETGLLVVVVTARLVLPLLLVADSG